MINQLISVIYPKRCPICEKIVYPREHNVCPKCKEKLQYIKEPRCKKCSKPIENEEAEYCYDCVNKRFHYQKGYAVWVYDEHLKKSISNFKYKNKREYIDLYTEEIINSFGAELLELKPDALIPIPIHKSKLKKRGFNQAGELAKSIGKRLRIPVYENVLIRNLKTTAQKELNEKERRNNLKKAFIIVENSVKLKKVILVDDIYTTGSTIEACTLKLLESGVEEVNFVCISIGKGF